MAAYHHRQTGFIHWLVIPPGVIFTCLALMGRVSAPAGIIAAGVTLITTLLFWYLTVSCDGRLLRVRFGPIGLFRINIPLGTIQSVEPATTTLLEGWGVHYSPGSGWIWNIAGRNCVKLTRLNGKALRIGTDEPDKLCQYIQTHIHNKQETDDDLAQHPKS